MSASELYLRRDSSIGVFLWILRIIQEHLFCSGSTNGLFWNTSAGISLQQSCKPDGLKVFNSVRKKLHKICLNFVNFLGKLFCRTPPSNHLSHDVVFSFLQISEVCSLKSIYLVEQCWIRRKNSQARSIQCSYGNQMETSLSSCGHTCTDLGIGSERKGRTEKLVKVG